MIGLDDQLIPGLEQLRRAEKEQTLTYRRLAAMAEDEGNDALAERFHALHADEQHHLSRVTARVLELGGQPVEHSEAKAARVELADWQTAVAEREADEISRYESLLAGPLDQVTRALLEEILKVERQHASELGGKWTMA